MKRVMIDRSRSLRDEPATGHNRFHPDIPPILSVGLGEDVVLETRDALDGQIGPTTTVEDLTSVEERLAHPLTGPIHVDGAGPGDILEIEFLDIVGEPHAWTAIFPGIGFLRDLYDDPFLVLWELDGVWAASAQLPGVRIPGAPFMGVSGVAPSHEQLREWTDRERALADRGGLVFQPDPVGAVPDVEPIASASLRTGPPRENGGNLDVKQLTRGSKLRLPVAVEGALFSTGDAHFAQGDGEVCISAIEMGASVTVRFDVLKGAAPTGHIRGPRLSHAGYFAAPEWATPKGFIGATGMPIRDDGVNEDEDLTLACRNAVLNLIDLLEERGWSREQAYVICSVAADLRVSNVVDVPNFVVTALLPEAIFVDE